jgi:hypothetical protein
MASEEETTTSTTQRLSAAASAAAATAVAKLTDVAPSTAEVASKAKDVANTAIGFGLMGAAKVQSQAKALLEKVPADSKTKAKEFAVKADSHVETLMTKVEDVVASAEGHLPDRAASVVRKARETGSDVRSKIREKVVPTATSADDIEKDEAPEA